MSETPEYKLEQTIAGLRGAGFLDGADTIEKLLNQLTDAESRLFELQSRFAQAATPHQGELIGLIRSWQEKHDRTNREVVSALLATAWTITNVSNPEARPQLAQASYRPRSRKPV